MVVSIGNKDQDKIVDVVLRDDGKLAICTDTVLEAGEIEIGKIVIKNDDTEDTAEVAWDGIYTSLAVQDARFLQNVDDNSIAKESVLPTSIPLNYVFSPAQDAWIREITDVDDDSLAKAQDIPIGINENYIFSKTEDAWIRQQGSDDGYLFNTTIGLYTPDGDSILDDTNNAMKVIDVNAKLDNSAFTPGTDYGYVPMAVLDETPIKIAYADGDYNPLRSDTTGSLRSSIQDHYYIDEMNSTTGWVAANDATDNLALTTNHVWGTGALKFDKVNGTGFTEVYIEKTISSLDLRPYHKSGGFLLLSNYLSDITEVAYVFVRLGTDSSNYNEWRVSDTNLDAGIWQNLRFEFTAPSFDGNTGNGFNPSAVTYIAVGVSFDSENDELADIYFDHLSANAGLHTTADISATISSDISSANVNILKLGNKVIDLEDGNVGTGTQRVVLATDQPAVAVTGTFWQATQPVSGTFWQATQPVSATDLDIRDLSGTTDGVAIYAWDGGNRVILNCNSANELKTTIGDSSGNFASILPTQADDLDNASNGLITSSLSYVFDGTTWDRARGDSTNGLLVNLGINNDVTVTGAVTATLGASDASIGGVMTFGPDGTGGNSTVTLTNATTAYQIPQSGSVPDAPYVLVIHNVSDTDVYWGYATLTSGGILLPTEKNLALNLGANQVIYAYCGDAGKVVNWTAKEMF